MGGRRKGKSARREKRGKSARREGEVGENAGRARVEGKVQEGGRREGEGVRREKLRRGENVQSVRGEGRSGGRE